MKQDSGTQTKTTVEKKINIEHSGTDSVDNYLPRHRYFSGESKQRISNKADENTYKKLFPEQLLINLGSLSFVIHPREIYALSVLVVISLIAASISLYLGDFDISYKDTMVAVFGFGDNHDIDVIRRYRLPRLIVTILAGFSFGVSGSVFQSISKNPLGSPDIIGFTQGAVIGAVIQIIFFQAPPSVVALSAFASGVLTSLVVYGLSYVGQTSQGGSRIILVGIGVGATIGALNGLMLLKGDLYASMRAMIWRVGALEGMTTGDIIPLIISTVISLPILLYLSKDLSLLESGDPLAQGLGISVKRSRFIAIVLSVALVSVATAVCGPIAFIALSAPQLYNRMAGHVGVSVIGSSMMGATLLLLADICARTFPLNATLPVGRLTAIIGGLYLIWLIAVKDKS